MGDMSTIVSTLPTRQTGGMPRLPLARHLLRAKDLADANYSVASFGAPLASRRTNIC
jgi:hypothetical protein